MGPGPATGKLVPTPRPAAQSMRDEYLQNARRAIDDPYVLINVVSRRVKQLRRGARPLVSSLEKLSVEDIALREIAEGLIHFDYVMPDVLGTEAEET